jgi:branched-subunit amino acid transport protein
MTALQSWGVVIGLAIGTFLIRYSFIGLFADRDMPGWLNQALKLMVPAIFAAIVFSGVAMVGGEVAGMAYWPRYAAAFAALMAAMLSRGNMMVTLGVGMLTLHGLPWLLH